jgi:hypothetical protein
MKTHLALLAAGAIVLTPPIPAASQPAKPATDSTQTQSTGQPAPAASDAAKPAATPDAACDTAAGKAGKSGDAQAAKPSAKVGKDTGDLPPPRSKKSTSNSKDSVCST